MIVNRKYDRQLLSKCGHSVTVDVYRVLDAFGTGSSAIDHAVKKLLAPGKRGHKDERSDLEEAIKSIQQRIVDLDSLDKLQQEKCNKITTLEAG